MASRRNLLLAGMEWLLWLAAAVALTVSAFVAAEGRIYQFYLNQKFDDAIQWEQKAESVVPPEASANPAIWPYIGRVQIPRLNMSLILLHGVDNQTLRRGIGHIPGTALPGEPGNVGIAGHRDTFFRRLEQIRKKDRITVQTLGNDYEYVVDSIRIVDPDALEVLNKTDHPVLTLVTCYPFYLVGPAPKRFIVRASLQE